METSKQSQYVALVEDRKKCNLCHSTGLTNPATIQVGALDSGEVGPWSRWNGDLNAQLLVVGQEWGDIASFERQKGLDVPSPTNDMLRDLLGFVGLPVERAPTDITASRVFLTNAALCLKVGGAQAAVKKEWFQNCGKAFLRAQIEIIRPQITVTLGEQAYRAIRDAFSLPKVSFRRAANSHQPIRLPVGGWLVPVYHCGQRILNTHRKRDAQFQDWLVVKNLLEGSGSAT